MERVLGVGRWVGGCHAVRPGGSGVGHRAAKAGDGRPPRGSGSARSIRSRGSGEPHRASKPVPTRCSLPASARQPLPPFANLCTHASPSHPLPTSACHVEVVRLPVVGVWGAPPVHVLARHVGAGEGAGGEVGLASRAGQVAGGGAAAAVQAVDGALQGTSTRQGPLFVAGRVEAAGCTGGAPRSCPPNPAGPGSAAGTACTVRWRTTGNACM